MKRKHYLFILSLKLLTMYNVHPIASNLQVYANCFQVIVVSLGT